MSSSLLLSVIIVSFNTADLTVQTVLSAAKSLAQSPLLSHSSEIIVIDNNSTDETIIKLQQTWQKQAIELQIRKLPENVGFGRANNLGSEMAKGKYYLFLNSDTVVEGQAIAKMVQAFESHPIDDRTADLVSHHGKLDRLGILAATLLNPDRSPQPQGGSFPNLLSLTTTMFFLDDLPLIGKLLPSVQHTGWSQHRSNATHQQLIQADWVGGTAMMVSATMWQEIGPFDQNIFMYGEDIELCLRAKQHHWDVARSLDAQIVHYGSASSSSRSALIGEFKGYLYIWAKHKPLWQMPFLKAILRCGATLKWLVFGIIGQATKAETYSFLLQNVLR